MDTDDLTPMAYEIIIKAHSVLDVLRSEIGAACEKQDSENAFLKGTLEFVERKIAEPESYLEFWNYLDEVEIPEFVENLKMLKRNILKTMETPIYDRGKPPFI